MTVIVVGAGIAGLACARELLDAGVPVRVLERGRVVGGRLASKRLDGRYADIGAGYLTADDPAFHGRLESWRIDGLAAPWTDTFDVYEGAERQGATTGPMRWAAPGGLRSLAENLAHELNITLEHEVKAVTSGDTAPLERSTGTPEPAPGAAAPVKRSTGTPEPAPGAAAPVERSSGTSTPAPGPAVDGVPADAVVLAMPGPQALRVLGDEFGTLREVAGAQRWSPVLAAVLTYRERTWRDFHAAFVNSAPVLSKVFDDGDRRSDRAPVLVAHSTAAFARQHLDDPQAAAAEMAAAVSELLEVPAAETHVHRWTYAQPEPGDEPYAAQHGVYLAGDAFGRPRVQTAWISGRAVARAIIAGREGS